MDLMTLAKGLEVDIDRLVKQKVMFKRSYNWVIVELNRKFVQDLVHHGWWDKVIMITNTCISICNDTEPGNINRSKNVSYWYLQNFKGRWIDNVRSSYLVRKIMDERNNPLIDWIHARHEEHPDGDVWNCINYYETELFEICDYCRQYKIYAIDHNLFIPSFDTGEHIEINAFDNMGLDRWRSCIV